MKTFLLLIGLTQSAAAWSQSTDESDSPWGTSSEDTETPETPPAEPAEEVPEAPEPENTGDTQPSATPAESTPVAAPDKPAAKEKKDPATLGKAHAPGGVRIPSYTTGTGVSMGLKAVLGTGKLFSGTNPETGERETHPTQPVDAYAVFMAARYTTERFGVVVGIPVARHSVPGTNFDNSRAHAGGLGNLTLDGYYKIQSGKVHSMLAVETHFNVGNRAYTWLNDGDELWPGFGVDVAWQGYMGDKLVKIFRVGLGMHAARSSQPFPGFFPRFQASFALDYAFTPRIGLITEGSFAYWDTSPLDLSVLGRFDLFEGIRGRAGLTLPIATWAGLVPAEQKAGLREVTWVMDLSYAF
jgi:hypothetical protein